VINSWNWDMGSNPKDNQHKKGKNNSSF